MASRESKPSSLPVALGADALGAVLAAPAAGIVQALEHSALNIVDSVENKAVEALESLSGQVEDFEERAGEFIGDLEEKAILAVQNLDELPSQIARRLEENPKWIWLVGLGIGAGVRIAQEYVPAETVRRSGKAGLSFLAKKAAHWALDNVAQRGGRRA